MLTAEERDAIRRALRQIQEDDARQRAEQLDARAAALHLREIQTRRRGRRQATPTIR